jgi:hypothetical protein
VVLADSRQISGVRRYSGTSIRQTSHFRLPDYHRLRCRFPTTSTSELVLSLPDRLADRSTNVPQPRTRNPCQVSHVPGLASIRFRSPLLTESLLFSLPAGTEMFHFPAFPPHTLCIQVRVTPHDWCWVPPFGHPGITARLTAPPGLSRPPASFIGSWCQGIHHVPSAT